MLQLATKADRSAVNELAAQVHAMHVAWRPDIYCMADELYPQERFDAHLANRELYVAKIEGNVAGYALLRMYENNRPGHVPRKLMLIDELCVHEAVRGHGIGSQMMEDIHALAKAFGCTQLKIGVYPQNQDAIRFYERFGFAIRSIDMMKSV